jgi:hypothetical protein
LYRYIATIGHSAAVFGNELYIYGGLDAKGNPINSVYVIDTVRERLSVFDLKSGFLNMPCKTRIFFLMRWSKQVVCRQLLIIRLVSLAKRWLFLVALLLVKKHI